MAHKPTSPVGSAQGLDHGEKTNPCHSQSTVGAGMANVTEIVHIPRPNLLRIDALTDRSTNFDMTSSPIASRLSGPHTSGSYPEPRSRPEESWPTATRKSALPKETIRSEATIDFSWTKQMFQQQQMAITQIAETLKSLQRPAGPSETVSIAASSVYDAVSESDLSADDSDEDTWPQPPPKKVKRAAIADDVSGKKTNLLDNLDNLFTNDTEAGPEIHPSLAKSVERGITNNFDLATGLELAEKHKAPSNCKSLLVPKLNEEIFFEDSIDKRYKQNDGILQKNQLLLTKGMVPLLNLMDRLLTAEQLDSEELFDMATNSFQLLTYAHRDMSNIRRKFLKPAVAQKYKRLCAPNTPLSTQLFGDDLDKQLQKINDHRKIGVKLLDNRKRAADTSHHQQRHVPKGGPYKGGHFLHQRQPPSNHMRNYAGKQKWKPRQPAKAQPK